MRSIIGLALAAAVALGGCSESLDDIIGKISISAEAATPASTADVSAAKAATAAKLDAHAVAKQAICDWGKSAGIPDLKPGLTDTVASRRRIAEVQAAYRTTCAVVAAPIVVPATSKAVVKVPVPKA